MKTHYHVVAFINGCLNDYDSGPIETLDQARSELTEYWADGAMQPWEPINAAGQDRYTNGPYIVKIESCDHPECYDGEEF